MVECKSCGTKFIFPWESTGEKTYDAWNSRAEEKPFETHTELESKAYGPIGTIAITAPSRLALEVIKPIIKKAAEDGGYLTPIFSETRKI